MKLNAEQIQAISTREGYWSCLATAGAGKTTVIVERVRALFKEGASQDDILVLTFTSEAAKNLETRLGIKPSKQLRGGFRTFHSFCLNLVRQESRFLSYGLSSDPFPDGPVLSRLMLAAMKKNAIRRKQFEELRGFISRMKRARKSYQHLEETGEYPDPLFLWAYRDYEKSLRDGGMLDFDGMLVEAVNILEKYPEVRERWQFKWLLADECQDTEDLQFLLMQMISENHKNVFIVSDPGQALYAFRGAKPENILEIQNWFPGTKTIILPINYRSSQEIVEFSKKNAPIKNELAENIRTLNPQSGLAIEFRMYAGSAEEAEAILSVAASDPGNSAILTRTNQQIGIFETLCMQHNIKFHLLGRSGLWNKPEIRMLTNLALFCMGNKPATKYSETLLASHRGNVRRLPPIQGLAEIMRLANLESLYGNEDYQDNENFAVLNLRTVCDISKRFSSLGEFLNHARKAAHASRKSKNALTLSTVHQAKGLEWNNVFVAGVQQGKLPHEKGDPEEEKRIFYVAITRPKQRLRLSFAGTPSQFLEPYLTPEIRSELTKHAEIIEKIQKQQELFV